jgi:hypothetical protein
MDMDSCELVGRAGGPEVHRLEERSGRIRVDRVPTEGYAAAVKVAWKVALTIVGVLVLALLLYYLNHGRSHGHVAELLEVTVRVVDRDTGEPLAGAMVATVRHRNLLEQDFDLQLEAALEVLEELGEDAWGLSRLVCPTKTGEDAVTTIRSAAYVTRHWFGPFETSKAIVIPRILLIDHPRHGRTIIPIDPETPVEEGDRPNTWRLDLGTVRVPE